MTNTRTAIALLVLALGPAGCGGSHPMPAAPSPVPQPAPQPAPTPGVFSLVDVTLSGVVSELTPTGQVPIEGVNIYCEPCGEITHSWAYTDSNGFYSFRGIWLSAGVSTPIWVTKDGYQAPPTPNGWIQVMISGDTRFDVQLVRR